MHPILRNTIIVVVISFIVLRALHSHFLTLGVYESFDFGALDYSFYIHIAKMGTMALILITATLIMAIDKSRHRVNANQSLPPTKVRQNSSKNKNYDQTPLNSGGANFATHRLHQRGFNILDIKPSWQLSAFSLVFILTGSEFLAFDLLEMYLSGDLHQLQSIDGILSALSNIGTPFILSGLFVRYKFKGQTATFDKNEGWYWQGKKPTTQVLASDSTATPLGNIAAIQIIDKWIQSSGTQRRYRSNYTSYEINLILNDHRRINLMDHANEIEISRNAAILSNFLNVPIV